MFWPNGESKTRYREVCVVSTGSCICLVFLECYLFFSYNLSIKNVFCIVYVYTWQDDAYVKIMPNQFRLTKHNGLTMTFSNGYNEIHL